MQNSICLTENEIQQITNRKRRDCQITALSQMGVDFKRRPDGSIVILRKHFNNVMGGDIKQSNNPDKFQANWNMVNA
ncbi:MAG: DUF4224 domain-containing protein [Rickettsiales bacterium]|nr:DUF4224 domain-containing protein [Pseudomonadota bacterium]MDA0966846.1 DUF4224 domain-containing protein [Pseudomonadota bacterium]MDG4543521.1 DUF4224 domain-containing protein [Rickettsiales bacterium]MDG4545669.1 DUF4224 domain-containing protein [Rickettsiales bacterium]MDG4547558.1 DUF4224 domain-containing protein [Rickettsiales bacterium]